MVDETRDGDGGSIIARHSSDSPPDTKPVDETVEGVDIISCMPHEIIHHILSFIPTQYGIRTSALSKAWRHVWCHTPCLDFDCFNKYGHWLYLVLDGSLCCTETDTGTEMGTESGTGNGKTKNVKIRRNVTETFPCRPGRVPVSETSSLEKLSVNFDMIPECTVSWKSLRKLALRSCNLNDESIDNILSGSPMLETLRLIYCTGPQRLDLRHMDIDRNDDQRLDEIVAPHINYLKLKSSYKPLTLVDVSCLMEANLDIFRRHSSSWQFNTPFREKADFLQTGVLKMLAKLQNAERLSFGGSLLQILSLAELRGVSFPTFKVQTLTLKTRFAKSSVPGITRLLHNSPGLKKLIADWYLDNYLESQGLNPDQCWRSKYDVFPTSDESDDMIVRNEESSWELVVSFVEMMLRNVTTLEMLVVGLKHIDRSFNDSNLLEDLLQMLPNNNYVSIVLKR
ncbi:PREDICTED: putative F-box/LRR-repeat protein At5g02700 [Brassica oleracea var. oleracea]|uniref:putative F-box/LRR-repeat protein At5g02700 n=1 Tax=Brassica oleracea var. oleracea TaxID=109376 RepID=UPI0006A6F32A|nr:PREDICTED: putative F-box/LRR-repeat protein At5g02700 [Brassica oleracea var. oleracea]